MSKLINLSRRERQIMDIVYELGEASGQQVQEKMPDALSYSTVRTLLRKLVEKGHLAHKEQGAKYVYYPLMAHETASQHAMARLLKTFFDGSVGNAVNALLGMSEKDLSQEELDKIEAAIKAAKKEKS